jgi:glyoxylase-like metal-dependent hydrolase (beta-lactamase superfamily II)
VAIHHLSCGTLCPYSARLVNGGGGWLEKGRIVCHCLLIESSDGLVLVDTGFGTGDVLNPGRLGRAISLLIRPEPAETETAIERVRAAGFDPAEVRHIVATHLDLDHAGGLGNFPEAEVHLTVEEHEVAMDPPLTERLRYAEAQWAHGPRWRTHTGGGDRWFGFESVRVLPGAEPEIALIPLPGHSRGHACVAVRHSDRWLLHCGDAYFHRGEIQIPYSCPPALRAFQRLNASDYGERSRNQDRLRELARDHGDEIELFCSHDPVELERLAAVP